MSISRKLRSNTLKSKINVFVKRFFFNYILILYVIYKFYLLSSRSILLKIIVLQK